MNCFFRARICFSAQVVEETYGVQPLFSYSGYVFVERHDGGYFLTKGIVFWGLGGVWFVLYGEGKR